jgi:hypothetical protein
MKRLVMSSVMFALVLGGCAFKRSMEAENAKTKLIGMTKQAFIQCAGEPWEMRSYGATETLLYLNDKKYRKGETIPGKVVYAVKSEIEGQYCEARVAITDGRVSAIRYSGQTGGAFTGGEACAPIVQGCM